MAALARGDVAAAVGHNAVAILAVLPLAVWLWVTWVRERPAPAVFRSRLFMPVAAAVLIVFTVARNAGVEPFSALAA